MAKPTGGRLKRTYEAEANANSLECLVKSYLTSLSVITMAFLPIIAAAQNPDPATGQPDEDQFVAQMKKCEVIYADHRLDPLRGKVPINWLEGVTDEMRANEHKVNAAEKKALGAYLEARMACLKTFFVNDDNAARQALDAAKERMETKINLLKSGKITYAEYARRLDEDVKNTIKNMGSQFEPKIESWLAPSKANYPADSPWWHFYNYAIATARQVDNGQMSEDAAQKLIEEQRLKVNQEIAAQASSKVVTLNCKLTSFDNQRTNEVVVTIDYGNNLVNGYKANINDSEIQWLVPAPDGSTNWHYRINRLSGFYSSGSNQFNGLWTGRCAPASRQF